MFDGSSNPHPLHSGNGAGVAVLSHNVLVLNKFYQAIRVINVKRAFSLLCRELAEVVHIETGADGKSQWQNFDFDEWTEPVPMIHYCFRVDEGAFNAILGRIKAAGIPYRSNVHGPVDFKVNTQHGGSIVYWNEPDGHQWEMLTVSYARRA